MADAQPKTRDASFDILKGIGIVAVIVLHATGYSARRYADAGSHQWWLLKGVNRFMSMGVPTFLLVSAVLLARSAERSSADWKTFYKRRAQGLVYPFLLWTVLYWLFRLFVVKGPQDVDLSVVLTPFGKRYVPNLVASGHDRLRDVLIGRANFHLYFMVILIQFAAVFPLFYYSLRKWRWGFGPVCLLAIALQFLAFMAQHYVLKFPYPGTFFAWYLVVLIPGVWVGLNWSQWATTWKTYRFPIVAAFVGLTPWFMVRAMQVLAEIRVDGLEMNAVEKLFAMAASLLLLGLSTKWNGDYNEFFEVMRGVGKASLQLYLVHPMILFFMGGPRFSELLYELPATPLMVIIVLIICSYLFAVMCSFLGLDRYIFGKGTVPLVDSIWSRMPPAD